MRITNKIMQNNSLYNINNNKVSEDQLNTMMSTGKKITRPSDDPVVAIRALRLRSNVTQLSQYYEKNAKDAESWLEVTADALSTITDVLTDAVKQATKGANKDLTLDDLSIIVTQLDALSKEYYATGNVDYAGRYVFTGYRTDTPLTFETATTASYADINDEFKAGDVSDSSRVVGKYNLDNATVMDDNYVPTLQSDIVEQTVGRLRLSYDNLDYTEGDGKSATLKYREKLEQPATSSITNTWDAVNLTFKDLNGRTRYASIPVNTNLTDYSIKSEGIVYKAQLNRDGSIDVTGSDPVLGKEYKVKVGADGTVKDMSMDVDSAIASIETKQVSTVTYTPYFGSNPISVDVPLLPAIDQTYTINLDKEGFTAVVNSDGTYTIKNNVANINDDGSYSNQIIQMTDNGSVHTSYHETTVEIDSDRILYNTSSAAEIDAAYNDIVDRTDGAVAYLNASTGEVLLNRTLRDKLSTLPDIVNSKTIDIIYDKKEWVNGDIRPENLFGCTYTDKSGQTIFYNQGSSDHDIAYDVGFSQSVVVNTMADAVFTTNVKRDVSDLSSRLDELQQMATTLKTLKTKLESTGDETKKAKIENDIASAQKAYDFMREEIQKDFEHKITSIQKSLDTANIAVTDNGTRSKRLDLISTRLMSQTTTFKALQSDNEDIDLAEAATKLTTAQVTYEASLMATGKISQTSLLNYL